MTETVHVITTLGPTDGPGLLVAAEMLPRDPMQDLRDQLRRTQEQVARRMAEQMADGVIFNDTSTRHTNHPCNPRVTFGGIDL